jgi:predicted component of type VI protein secretion system
MNVNLVVQNGPNKARKIPLRTSEVVIGRRKGCQVRVPSADVSRNHCKLSVQDGFVIVEDLDSFNGTYVNGERVNSARPVRPGDRLGVGPVSFIVEYELTSAGLQALTQRFPTPVTPAASQEEEVPIQLAGDEEEAPIPLAGDEEEAPIPLAGDDVETVGVNLVEDESEELAQPILLSENEILPEGQDAGVQEISADFDESAPWHLPEPDQLRDILKQMDKPKGGR